MSAIEGPIGAEGPEYGALMATRRWLVVIGAAVSGGMTLLIGLLLFTRLSTMEHVIMVVAATCLSVGLLRSREPGYLWLATAGLAALVLVTVVAPAGELRWIPLNLLISYIVYYVAMLSSPRVGLAACFIGAAVLALIWSQRPTNAIVANLALLGGWIAVLQVICGSVFLWWSWNRLKGEAAGVDRDLRLAEERTAAAIRSQERARLWRSTAVHLHESILNTIRYVLTAPNIDRSRLGEEVRREHGLELPNPSRRATSIASVVAALEEDNAGLGVIKLKGWIPDLPLDPAGYEAVRAAAIELARNAVRHGGATTVDVSARLDIDGRILLRLADNGTGQDDVVDPGVGRSTTLDAALAEVGAIWEREARDGGGTVSSIHILRPDAHAARASRQGGYLPFDKGRLLVTSALAGIIGAGSLYYIHMALVGTTPERIAGLLGLVGACIAIFLVVKRRRVHPSIALALVVAPAMVPWFLLAGEYACKQAAPLSPVLNIAGYSVMVIAAWSGVLPGAVGLSVWAVSGGLLISQVPEGCRDSVAVALVNSLIALPVILSIAYAGARAYQRAQDEAQETRQREIVERTTAAAAADINNQLDASVREAEAVLAEIVDGAEVTGPRRDRLHLLDARIRAGIQVDPQSDGTMAVLAKSLVDAATDNGVSVSVRAITSSPSTFPIPLTVRRTAYLLVVGAGQKPARLHVFTDGEEDHLSVVTSRAALRGAGLRPGEERMVGGVVVEVEDNDDDSDGQFVVMLSHPCT